MLDDRVAIDAHGSRVLLSELAHKLIQYSDCPKEFKRNYFKDKTKAIIELKKLLINSQLPAKNYIETQALKVDYKKLEEFKIIPCICPHSGIRYFYSQLINKVVPYSFQKFSKEVKMKLPRIYELSLEIPLKLGIEVNNGLKKGFIYCNDGSPFVFQK
jgi:hypothetical protein